MSIQGTFALVSRLFSGPVGVGPDGFPLSLPTPLACGYAHYATRGQRVALLASDGATEAQLAREFYAEPSAEDWMTPEGREACQRLIASHKSAQLATRVQVVDPATVYNGPSYADAD